MAESAMRRSLVTPEGVDLSLRLADAGQRFSAFLVDALIMVGTLVAVTVLLIIFFLVSEYEAIAELILVLWLIGFFLLRNFYFILLEMGPRAATFGKRALGLRVVARNGDRLTADRVIARNLMREIEIYLPLSFLGYEASEGTADAWVALAGFGWAAIFLFFPLFNRERLRVGDLIAGTWVINAPRRALRADLLDREAAEDHRFTSEQLDVYGVFELQTLEQVLRDDQPEAMAIVAESIRRRIGAEARGADRDFLSSYYEAARAHMERRLLFGRRRENKFDQEQGEAAAPRR